MSGPPPDHIAAKVVINVHRNGAMSIEGPMDEREWMIACLENALAAVKAHRRPKQDIVVPGRDVDMGPVLPKGLVIGE